VRLDDDYAIILPGVGFTIGYQPTAGGKSGQLRDWQLLTATGGNPRESATETTQPFFLKKIGNGETSGVRVLTGDRQKR